MVKITLRLPDKLHKELKVDAGINSQSLNGEIIARLNWCNRQPRIAPNRMGMSERGPLEQRPTRTDFYEALAQQVEPTPAEPYPSEESDESSADLQEP